MRTAAVIGGGVAGIGAAYNLAKAGYKVSVLEISPRLGGNCFGVDLKAEDGTVHRVDAGVTDFNRDTFVNVHALIDDLGLDYAPINQDASFMHPDGRTGWYTRDGEAIFVEEPEDRERLTAEITRFNTECGEVLGNAEFAGVTLDDYLDARGYGREIRQKYLYPRAAGCFPMPDEMPGDYQVQSVVGFWTIHGITGGGGKPNRLCVIGGMYRYCEVFEDWLRARGGEVLTACRVVGVSRRYKKRHPEDTDKSQFVRVRYKTRDDEHLTKRFDHVVFACGSNRVVPLLEDKRENEVEIFPRFPYQRAVVAIHHDPAFMPDDREAWGAYNYLYIEEGEPEILPSMTFWMNRLGKLEGVPEVFVTLNPTNPPDPEEVIAERFWVHPIADGSTGAIARQVDAIQGRHNTWFAGSYLREPFVHEPALETGLDVAEALIAADRAAGLAPQTG